MFVTSRRCGGAAIDHAETVVGKTSMFTPWCVLSSAFSHGKSAMPQSCVAVGCAERHSKGKSFHRFPRSPRRWSAWLNVIKRRDWVPSYGDRLCEKYFISGDKTFSCSFQTWLKYPWLHAGKHQKAPSTLITFQVYLALPHLLHTNVRWRGMLGPEND